MIDVRVTRPCAKCAQVRLCNDLVAGLKRLALEHEARRPQTPDLEIVVDCKMYVPEKRRR